MERINKVLASTAQAFSTAEQKQARDNIGAQASGDYVYSTAFNSFSAHVESAKIPYSAISGNNSVISSIGGSALSAGAGFSGIYTTNAFTGSGTNSADKLGLNSAFQLTSVGGTKTAAYSESGVQIVGGVKTAAYSNSGVQVNTDLGGSTSVGKFGGAGMEFLTPLPGDDWVSAHISIGGIEAYGNFGSNAINDSWNSSHRFQGTGDTGNGTILDIGFYNGDEVVRYPYFTMYTPTESATIYMSSISSWNSKLSSVNVGTGLSGDGASTPIAVTGFSSIFQGYHSDYYCTLTGHELAFSAYNKDSAIPENKCVVNEYGVRLSAYQDDRVARLQTDGVSVGNSATDMTAMLDEKKLRMTDATAYADLTRSSIDAINAVYNWATSQGMSPIN